MISTKYSRNKWIMSASYISLILLALLLITKIFLPDVVRGWSNLLIFDFFYILGIGICISILGAGYTFYSWTLKAQEYSEWNAVQQKNFENWLVRLDSMPSDNTLLWSTRIAAPVAALLGLGLSILMLIAISTFFYN